MLQLFPPNRNLRDESGVWPLTTLELREPTGSLLEGRVSFHSLGPRSPGYRTRYKDHSYLLSCHRLSLSMKVPLRLSALVGGEGVSSSITISIHFFANKSQAAFLVVQMVQNLPAVQATHSSILAWRIPWTEELGGLQFTGSQRVRCD